MMKKMYAIPNNVSGGRLESAGDWYFIINERTGKACYATKNPEEAHEVNWQVNYNRRAKIPYFLDSIDDVK